MHHQYGVDDLQVLVELGFGEGLDAVVLRFDSAHHCDATSCPGALRDLRAGTV